MIPLNWFVLTEIQGTWIVMKHEKIEIRIPGYEAAGILYTYFLDNSSEMDPDRKRPLILICPGGGYKGTSDREAEPVAIRFLAMGYHAAVLRYSTSPSEYPLALLQLAASVRYFKRHAQECHVNPERIILMGFSAGGHLAACLGVFWKRRDLFRALGAEPEDVRPAGMILGYPVITSGEFANLPSFRYLLGDRLEEMKAELSLELQVTPDTAPTFLWHTMEDQMVPVENSIMFFMALKKAGVSAELHIYPCGEHGLSLANEETSRAANGFGIQKECESWIDLAEAWLSKYR